MNRFNGINIYTAFLFLSDITEEHCVLNCKLYNDYQRAGEEFVN